MANMGWVVTFAIAAFMIVGQVAFLYSELWIARWAEAPDQGDSRWVTVYGAIVISVVVVGVLRSLMFFHFIVIANSKLHLAMTAAVLRAPLAFFH